MTATVERFTLPRPGRDAWLELRHDWWNASDTAALFGEHPFCTLADVVARKRARAVVAETTPMRRGRHLEAAVAAWWAEDHAVELYEPAELYGRGVVLATLDRRLVDVDDEAVEIKTVAHTVLEPKRYWWWQVQAQLYVTGFARVHLVVFDAGMELQTFVVEPDVAAIDALAGRAADVMRLLKETPDA